MVRKGRQGNQSGQHSGAWGPSTNVQHIRNGRQYRRDDARKWLAWAAIQGSHMIWRTAIDMERENNIEERGDSKTLKVGESFLSHQIFTIERDDVNVWAMALGNFNFIQYMTFKR